MKKEEDEDEEEHDGGEVDDDGKEGDQMYFARWRTHRDQSGFAKITKYKNSSSANPLRTLLTACNMPERASS